MWRGITNSILVWIPIIRWSQTFFPLPLKITLKVFCLSLWNRVEEAFYQRRNHCISGYIHKMSLIIDASLLSLPKTWGQPRLLKLNGRCAWILSERKASGMETGAADSWGIAVFFMPKNYGWIHVLIECFHIKTIYILVLHMNLLCERNAQPWYGFSVSFKIKCFQMLTFSFLVAWKTEIRVCRGNCKAEARCREEQGRGPRDCSEGWSWQGANWRGVKTAGTQNVRATAGNTEEAGNWGVYRIYQN